MQRAGFLGLFAGIALIAIGCSAALPKSQKSESFSRVTNEEAEAAGDLRAHGHVQHVSLHLVQRIGWPG